MSSPILLSPNSKHFKAQTDAAGRKATIKKAAIEVKALRAANGGDTKYGEMARIINKYQSVGYSFVTRGTLCHFLASEKKTCVNNTCPVSNVFNETPMNDDHNESQQSSLPAEDH